MSRPYSKELLDFLSKTNSKKVGIQLAKICIKAKLPASGIAEVFGVTRQAVHGWFRGKYIREKKIIFIKEFIKIVQKDLDKKNLPTKNESLAKKYLQKYAVEDKGMVIQEDASIFKVPEVDSVNESLEELIAIKKKREESNKQLDKTERPYAISGTDDYCPGYIGDYKDGKYHGQGRLIKDDKEGDFDDYSGEFFNGKYHGQGSLERYCGTKYHGEFKNGLYDGQGVKTFGDYREYDYHYEYRDLDKLIYDPINSSAYFFGYIYVGEFKNGEYHGQGILTYSSEIKYSGEFKLGSLYFGSLNYFDDVIYFEKGLVVK